jgi:hypothetical protein
VSGIDKALRSDTPLYGKIPASINRQAFVDAPANGAMVYYDVVVVHRTQAVAFVISH